jgi:hypothetical protein
MDVKNRNLTISFERFENISRGPDLAVFLLNLKNSFPNSTAFIFTFAFQKKQHQTWISQEN